MAQVFISYKSTERDEVAKIAIGLQGEGFTVWWDHALLGGQDYSQVIDGEIASAKVVMPIWSKDSIKSRWVSAEAERGWDKLFPVRIDDVQPPLPYNKLHTLDLKGWSGDSNDPRWRRLVVDLRAIVSGEAPDALQSLPTSSKKRNLAALAAWVAAPVAAVVLGFLAFQNLDALRAIVAPSEAASIEDAQVTMGQAETGSPAAQASPQVAAGERGIVARPSNYPEAVAALRQSGSQVALQICPEHAPCGASQVRVGEVIRVRVTSQVSGQLILLDENARGEQTQIYPNGLSTSGAGLSLAAGQSVDLPLASHGFVFAVSEPAGPSRLVAMVLPEAAPLPAIVVENTTERGIAAVPLARRDEFAASVANALPSEGGRASAAIGELSYVVIR